MACIDRCVGEWLWEIRKIDFGPAPFRAASSGMRFAPNYNIVIPAENRRRRRRLWSFR